MFFDVEKKIEEIKKKLHNSQDVASRIFDKNGQKIGMIFIKSMTNETLFSDNIYKPIKEYEGEITAEKLVNRIIINNVVEEIKEKDVLSKVLNGNAVILLGNENKFVSADIEEFIMRTPTEPPTSPVIRGPREGFTEDIKTNITLLRRRFYSEKLVMKDFTVGRYSNTKVCVAYLDGVANKDVVSEIEKKLKKIDIDGVVDAYYIGKYLENYPKSLFKQVGNAEKPDIVAAKILEGRVAVLVDGSPIVLTLPFIFFEDMQNSNDYYTSNHYATYIRIIRLFGYILSVVVSGAFLALRLFHYNVIPTKFLITIADTTQAIPFTPFIEILFITLLFQILYEVSLRLPSYLGLATSIVGALILGDTGVNAGLISPPGVIVIALSKIAVYTLPEQAPQITILQVLFIFLGGCFGLYGVVAGIFYLVNYLNRIDSYGVPYLAPYSPRVEADLKDAMIKKSLVEMKHRPMSFNIKNKTRQK